MIGADHDPAANEDNLFSWIVKGHFLWGYASVAIRSHETA